jgi:hypothetical protein
MAAVVGVAAGAATPQIYFLVRSGNSVSFLPQGLS